MMVNSLCRDDSKKPYKAEGGSNLFWCHRLWCRWCQSIPPSTADLVKPAGTSACRPLRIKVSTGRGDSALYYAAVGLCALQFSLTSTPKHLYQSETFWTSSCAVHAYVWVSCLSWKLRRLLSEAARRRVHRHFDLPDMSNPQLLKQADIYGGAMIN